jgi:hypothetical protein
MTGPVISIYTAFYFDFASSSHSLYPSIKAKSSGERVSSYMDCVLCMFWSARSHYPEANLVFIVNDSSNITSEYRVLFEKLNVQVVELEPASVPSISVRFKGAFFKLDAVSYIGKAGSGYCMMLDSDAVITSRDNSLEFFIDRGCRLAYSISKPGDAFESKSYLHSLFEQLSGEPPGNNCEWVGGEFLAGPPKFFEEVDEIVKKSTESYWKIYSGLRHIGDEVLLSCAVSILAGRGGQNIVLNPHVVHRYWTRGVVGYGQLHYGLLKEIPILHLPDQKLFGFPRLARKIKRQPDMRMDREAIARTLGYSTWCREALYRSPLGMLRRTLPGLLSSVLRFSR